MVKTIYNIAFATTLILANSSIIAAEQTSTMQGNQHIAITPKEIKWVEGPNALPPGSNMVIVEGDPSKAGLYTMRLKAPANYNIPAHWHPTDEHVTVLQGTFYMGVGDKLDLNKEKELPAGSFAVMPQDVHHYARTGKEEVILQLHGMGPWEIKYIDPKDDPRNNTAKK